MGVINNNDDKIIVTSEFVLNLRLDTAYFVENWKQ